MIISDVNQNSHETFDEMWKDIEEHPTFRECIFCGLDKIKNKGSRQHTINATTDYKQNRIRTILKIESCTEKLLKVQNLTCISYHPTCLAKYEHKLFYGDRISKKTRAKPLNNWTLRRTVHENAIDAVRSFVDEKIIAHKEVHALADIHQLYLSVFNEEAAKAKTNLEHTSYTRQHLCTKLLITVPNLTKTVYKKRTFLHRDDLSLDELCAKGFKAGDDCLSQKRN